MTTGYCTVEDIRRVLQERDLPGDINQDRQIAIDAITGVASWVRDRTGSHFYDGSGSISDPDNIIPTTPRTRGPEFRDIPSSPHNQHDQAFNDDVERVPVAMSGPYTKVKLDRRQAASLSSLLIRDASGDFEDWTTAGDKVGGTGEDYELITRAGDTRSDSFILVDTRSLPPLRRYDGAVRVTYDYGLDTIPDQIRRATAFRAASNLVEDAVIQIPNNATVYGVESLAEQFERKADELLEAFR